MINFVHNRDARLTCAFNVVDKKTEIDLEFSVAAGNPSDIWIRKRGVETAKKRLLRRRQIHTVKISPDTIRTEHLIDIDSPDTVPLQNKTHWVADHFVWFVHGLKKRRIVQNLDIHFSNYLLERGVSSTYHII